MMPGRDKTGPQGMGPGTGRGLGDCNGNEARTLFGYGCLPGSGMRSMCGRGGYGHGNRRMFYATGLPGWYRYGNIYNQSGETAADEQTLLEREAAFLTERLEQVNKRLHSLKEDMA